MSTGCSDAIAILIAAAEAGAVLRPILFPEENCNQSGPRQQWPPQNYNPTQNFFGHEFNPRNADDFKQLNLPALCPSYHNLNPADPNMNGSPAVNTCRTPAIKSVIIPDPFQIIFTANSQLDSQRTFANTDHKTVYDTEVLERGQLNLDNANNGGSCVMNVCRSLLPKLSPTSNPNLPRTNSNLVWASANASGKPIVSATGQIQNCQYENASDEKRLFFIPQDGHVRVTEVDQKGGILNFDVKVPGSGYFLGNSPSIISNTSTVSGTGSGAVFIINMVDKAQGGLIADGLKLEGPGASRGTGYTIDSILNLTNNKQLEGRLMQTIVGCGYYFWPSVVGVKPTYESTPDKFEQNEPSCGVFENFYLFCYANGSCRIIGDLFQLAPTYCLSETFDQGPNPTVSNINPANYAFINGSGDPQPSTCAFTSINSPPLPAIESFCDCIASKNTYVHRQEKPPFFRQLCNNHANNNPIPCACEQGLSGSIGTFKIGFKPNANNTIPTWRDKQIQYCSGQERLQIAGIPIQRYKMGSQVCDDIMNEACLDTALITNNPALLKSCSCILEQKRNLMQFANLSLPLNCFSVACTTSDPGVYKTQSQALGCSARLCQQVLSINSSALVESGFQNLMCHGQIYNLPNLVETTSSDIFSTANNASAPSGVSLGTFFYISLAVLGVMVLLVTVWIIYRVRLQKAVNKEQNRQVQKLLLESISRKTNT